MMTKTLTNSLTYSGFAIASLLVILIFVTAKTYTQLAVAIILYPALIFLFFMIFPRKSWNSLKTSLAQVEITKADTVPNNQSVEVADINRRTFIKLIWATGISFILFSILGRKVESALPNWFSQVAIRPTESGNQVGQAEVSPTEGYKISEIDEGTVSYYGFVNKVEAWLIMREDTNNTFRYAKGNSDFPGNWKNRENLKYDYFYNLF